VIRSLVIKPEAIDEVLEAAAWYESERTGLGLEFIAEIDRIELHIVERPESFAIWKPGEPFRRALAGRFPYAVFFEVEPERFVVYAVAHTSRRPGYWAGRRG
jgi:hypothetical protein